MLDETKTIIIDLTQDLLSETIDTTQLIHQQCAEQLVKYVRTAFLSSTIPPSAGNRLSRLANQVFFIDGTRGAGKSTFLAAVSKALPTAISGEKNPPSLLALPVIDPTMIETGELHVLFSILFQIKAKVEECKKCCNSWDKTEPNYEGWRKALQKLARGANLLNGHKPANPMDDLLSMEEGLESARSGANLSALLKNFLIQSAAILKVQGFIIAFDDVDTNFDSGWQVLELIRRYLQCPQLVVLITGDLQLYTHLVRRQQFKHLGDELHKQDKSRERDREDMVDHLEQQYLLKIFPLENRIHLAPLAILLSEKSERNTGTGQITYYVKTDESLELIDSYINALVRNGLLIKLDSQVKIFANFLLMLPVRAVIQILRNYRLPTGRDAPFKLAESLRGVLMGSLYKLGIDVDSLSHFKQGKLHEAVFDAIVSDGELDTGIYMRPLPSDEAIRNVYVALSAEVAAQCYERPASAIRYLLVAIGSIALLQRQNKDAIKVTRQDGFVTKFKSEMSIGREEDALNWARYAAANLLPVADESIGVGAGVLKLNFRVKGKEAGIQSIGKILGGSSLHNLQHCAFRIATHQVQGGLRIRQYMSVFNLLGAIERLLLINDKSEIERTLASLCSSVTVTAPGWDAKIITSTEEDDVFDAADEELQDNAPEYISAALPAFMIWFDQIKVQSESITPSALFIGKIWPRLYFSLGRVADQCKKFPAGRLMHLNVICLLNAFLIEEQDHHFLNNAPDFTEDDGEKVIQLDRRNPITSSVGFFEKLISSLDHFPFDERKVLNSLESRFPFTMLLMKCPLITPFLIYHAPTDGGLDSYHGLNKDQIDELRKDIKLQIRNKFNANIYSLKSELLARTLNLEDEEKSWSQVSEMINCFEQGLSELDSAAIVSKNKKPSRSKDSVKNDKDSPTSSVTNV